MKMSSAFWRNVSRPAANRRLSRSSLAANWACQTPAAGILAQVEVLNVAIAFQGDEFQVAQRVRLERLQFVAARRQVVGDDVDATQPFEVHVAVGEDFVEGQKQAGAAAAGDFRADEAGEVDAKVHDLPTAGWQAQAVAGGPGLIDRPVGCVGDGLQFQRGDGFQILFEIAAELRADGGEGAVFPQVVGFEAGPEFALGDEPHRLPHGVIRIINAAGQKRPGRQDGDFRRRQLFRREPAPAVVAGSEAIDLGKRPLEAVALHFLHPLFEDDRRERRALAGGRGEHLAGGDDFRLEERRLVEQIVAVHVVTADFKGNDVQAGLKAAGKVPLVHAVVAVRPARRAVAEELAVQEHAINGGARGAQDGLIPHRRGEARAEADRQVLLRLAPFSPDRFGGDQGGRRRREAGCGRAERQQKARPDRGFERQQVSQPHIGSLWVSWVTTV